MPISSSPAFTWASAAFGTIFIGFGINAIVNPVSALSFFELAYHMPPQAIASTDARITSAKTIIDCLMIIYGVRDIFMGTAIYAAAYYGSRTDKRLLGWIVFAAGLTAVLDGAVCKFIVHRGEMNHWGYAPVLLVLGASMAAGL